MLRTSLAAALADATTSFEGSKVAGCPTCNCPRHWIEISLVDSDGDPVPGEAFKLTAPNGQVSEGALDHMGFARLDGLPVSGVCQIEFPRLQAESWERLG